MKKRGKLTIVIAAAAASVLGLALFMGCREYLKHRGAERGMRR